MAPEKVRDPGFLETLKRWNPQLIVVVAYGRILPTAVLELAPHGCLNVHYSLLPKYRGAAPAVWTILNGEEKGGGHNDEVSGEDGLGTGLFAKGSHAGAG